MINSFPLILFGCVTGMCVVDVVGWWGWVFGGLLFE